ncbi:hypothetical protein Tco_1311035 [Tanacetum coccineum]
MLLTRLFKYVMSSSLELLNDRYVLYDRVMFPLAPHYDRKTQNDYGMKRGHPSTFASSSSSFDHPSSSHHIDDDKYENDEGTSHASTPSPTRYVNSLSNEIPQVFSNPPKNEQTMQTFSLAKPKFETASPITRSALEQTKVNQEGIKNLWKGNKEVSYLENG